MNNPRISIRPMTLADHAAAYALWSRTDGVGVGDADLEPGVARFLERNPGMSCVAENGDGKLIAAMLCGHDGRRGYLHHLAVEPAYRRQGIGIGLVQWSLKRLKEAGIDRCNIAVLPDNDAGRSFWLHNGWLERPWSAMQKVID